jgi:hypothetical protein
VTNAPRPSNPNRRARLVLLAVLMLVYYALVFHILFAVSLPDRIGSSPHD